MKRSSWKRRKKHISRKIISILLIIAFSWNQVSFASDEIRSCLAPPNSFTPPCIVHFNNGNPTASLNETQTELMNRVPGEFLLRLIAAGIGEGFTIAQIEILIENVLIKDKGDRYLLALSPYNWRDLQGLADNAVQLKYDDGKTQLEFVFAKNETDIPQPTRRLWHAEGDTTRGVWVAIVPGPEQVISERITHATFPKDDDTREPTDSVLPPSPELDETDTSLGDDHTQTRSPLFQGVLGIYAWVLYAAAFGVKHIGISVPSVAVTLIGVLALVITLWYAKATASIMIYNVKNNVGIHSAKVALKENFEEILSKNSTVIMTKCREKGSLRVRVQPLGKFVEARRKDNLIYVAPAFANNKTVLRHEIAHWLMDPAHAPPTFLGKLKYWVIGYISYELRARLYEDLLDFGIAGSGIFASMRRIVSGGIPLREELGEAPKDKFDVLHYSEQTTSILTLRQKFQALNTRYHKAIAQLTNLTGLEGTPLDPIRDREEMEEMIRHAERHLDMVVEEYYSIGMDALAADKEWMKDRYKQEYAGEYAIAIYCFTKVKQMKPLTSDAYWRQVEDLPYKPPRELAPSLRETISEKIKDYEKKWTTAIKKYLGIHSLQELAVDNILYDLRISEDELFTGGDPNGRSFTELMDVATTLSRMLHEETGPSVASYAQKSRTAFFLSRLFATYFFNHASAAELDDNGGLHVPKEVNDLLIKSGDKTTNYLEAEALSLGLFAFPGYSEADLNGHSPSAAAWLVDIYMGLAAQFRQKSIGDSLVLETRRLRPNYASAIEKLQQAHKSNASLEDMLSLYNEHFPQANEQFRAGAMKGIVLETPIREELLVGAVGDFASLSANFPYLYNVINASGLLTKGDGTVDRNLTVSVEIKDLKDMPKAKGGKAGKQVFSTVDSLDMGFHFDVTGVDDLLGKSDVVLVLDTLTSLGIFPKPLLEKVKAERGKEGREGVEEMALKNILAHLFGEDRGISINLFVDNIASKSGLAVSNLIAMSIALAFNRLIDPMDGSRLPADEASLDLGDIEEEKCVRLEFKPEEEPLAHPRGYYEIQICSSNQFEASDKTVYSFPGNFVDGSIQVSIPSSAFAQSGTYYVRRRYIKKELDAELQEESDWFQTFEFNITESGSALTDASPIFSVWNESNIWEYTDDAETVMRAIINSQWTSLRLNAHAGTQDDVAVTRGGIRWLSAGDPLEGEIDGRHVYFPGGVVPKIQPLMLSDTALERLNKGMKVFRVGLSSPAEIALDQFYNSHVLNSATDADSAWEQLTIESIKALARGDIDQLGRLAMATVALRERIGGASINPIVLNPVMEMVNEYGKDGFRFGITGARSEGSILVFVPEGTAGETMLEELRKKMDQSMKKHEKIMQAEDSPKAYQGKLSPRGARLRVFAPSEMGAYNARHVAPMAKKEELNREARRAAYANKDAASILERFKVEDIYESSLLVRTAVLNFPQKLIDAIQERFDIEDISRLTVDNFPEITPEQLEDLAGEALLKKYDIFESSVNHAARKMVKEALMRNINIIIYLTALPEEHSERLSETDRELLLRAISEGKIDVLTPFSHGDFKALSSALDRYHNKDIDDDELEMQIHLIQRRHQRDRNEVRDHIHHAMRISPPKDGDTFQHSDFQTARDTEIMDREQKMEAALRTAERHRSSNEFQEAKKYELIARRHELIIEALKRSPNPERLGVNNFLFEVSTAYKEFFGKKIALLKELMAEGAVAYHTPAGGAGTRFGNFVKQLVPWHHGNEPDAGFLKHDIRKWVAFCESFPEKRQGIIQILVSAATEDAILGALDELIKDSGAKFITTTRQSLTRVVVPTEIELVLEMALETADTPEALNELRRKYGWWINHSNDLLRIEKDKLASSDQGDLADSLVRAPFTNTGLNPLIATAPSGTAGNLEGLVDDSSELYTVDSLKNMGYTLNEELLQLIPEEEKENGMPLAKAALIVEGNGLSVVMMQNSTSRAPIVPLHLADAAEDIINNDRFAIMQYTNAAGGTTVGGVLVKEKDTGIITSLEGNLLKGLHGAILEEDFTAIATGTIFLNAKRLYQVLGMSSKKAYLEADAEKRHEAMRAKMEEWPKIIQMKERKEELVGDTREWPVLQQEVVLAILLGELQREEAFKGSVRYQEVTARVGYIDDKTPEQLYDGLSQQQANRSGAGAKTTLRPQEFQDTDTVVNDALEWARIYEKYGLYNEAIKILEDTLSFIGREKEKFGTIYSTLAMQHEEALGTRLAAVETLLREAGTMPVSKLNPRILKKKVIEYIRTFDKLSEDSPIDISNRDARLNELSSFIMAISTYIDKGREPAIQETLEYLKKEFLGFFNRIAEAHLTEAEVIHGFRIFPHKIIGVMDKDATIEDAGTAFKDIRTIPDYVQEPARAQELILNAAEGMTFTFITGSTAKEAWDHVFEPMLRIIPHMDIPIIAKVAAFERIKLLANDGGSIVSVDTSEAVKLLTTDENGTVLDDTMSEIFRPQVQYNQVYKDGQWYPLQTLDQEKRIRFGNVIIKTFLKQAFGEETILKAMREYGLDVNLGELEDFIEGLTLDNSAFPETDITTLYTIEPQRMAWYFAHMLRTAEDDGKFKPFFDDVLATQESVWTKMTQNNLAFTPQEYIMALLMTMRYKESHLVFASVDGAPLTEWAVDRTDPRFSALGARFLSQDFWENLVGRIDEEGGLKGLVSPEDTEGELVDLRAGRGYLNMPIGGVSKKTFINGMLHDPITANSIMLIMGDSITDQGRFPHVATVIYRGEPKDVPESLKTIFKIIPSGTEGEYILEFEGEMTPEDYETLSILSPEEAWQEAVTKLLTLTSDVYRKRLALRFLLGDLSEEMDDDEKARRKKDGLLEVEYMGSAVDPAGDGFTLVRKGPATTYPVLRALIGVAQQGGILPRITGTGLRNGYVRGMIEWLNDAKVDGMRIIPPFTLWSVAPPTCYVPQSSILGDSFDELSEAVSSRINPMVTDRMGKLRMSTQPPTDFDKQRPKAVILDANGIVDNFGYFDIDDALTDPQGLLQYKSPLSGGTFIIYGDKEKCAFLKDLITKTNAEKAPESRVKIVVISEEDITPRPGETLSETERLEEVLDATNRTLMIMHEFIGIIKGATGNPAQLQAFSQEQGIPVVVFSSEAYIGIYSFKMALAKVFALRYGNEGKFCDTLPPVSKLSQETAETLRRRLLEVLHIETKA